LNLSPSSLYPHHDGKQTRPADNRMQTFQTPFSPKKKRTEKEKQIKKQKTSYFSFLLKKYIFLLRSIAGGPCTFQEEESLQQCNAFYFMYSFVFT
jgi:hypothetical protein